MAKLGRPALPDALPRVVPVEDDWIWAAELYVMAGSVTLDVQAELRVTVRLGRSVENRERLLALFGGRAINAPGQSPGRFVWTLRERGLVWKFLAGVEPHVTRAKRAEIEELREREREELSELQLRQGIKQEGARLYVPLPPQADAPKIQLDMPSDYDADVIRSYCELWEEPTLVFGVPSPTDAQRLAADVRSMGFAVLQTVGRTVTVKPGTEALPSAGGEEQEKDAR